MSEHTTSKTVLTRAAYEELVAQHYQDIRAHNEAIAPEEAIRQAFEVMKTLYVLQAGETTPLAALVKGA